MFRSPVAMITLCLIFSPRGQYSNSLVFSPFPATCQPATRSGGTLSALAAPSLPAVGHARFEPAPLYFPRFSRTLPRVLYQRQTPEFGGDSRTFWVLYFPFLTFPMLPGRRCEVEVSSPASLSLGYPLYFIFNSDLYRQ